MRSFDAKLSIRELVLFGLLGAMTFALKMGMFFLPNIEPVSLCIMVYATVFGWKALYPTYVYVAMEILYWGIGTWNVCYLYIWPLLAVIALCLRNLSSPWVWAVVSGAFGLLFGALCGIVDVFIGGWSYAVAKWISGIPFDITHCIGNFLIALILFVPLRKLVDKLYKRLRK